MVSGSLMVVGKPDKKCPFYGLKYLVFEGLPNHMIGAFEKWTKKCLKSQMFGFQVLGIQIVTVFWIKLLVNCQLVRSCFVIADLGWYA